MIATRAMLEAAAPAAAALPSLETLLVSGGDARLSVDPISGLNAYGCRPAPRPEAIDFASSTASSISAHAWLRAERVRQEIESGGSAYCESAQAAARAELARLLGLDREASIVYAPSGTDAALLALAVARMIGGGEPLVSIIAAADETGRGMRNACLGRHFDERTSRGLGVASGEIIAGFADVRGIPVPVHDAAGMRPQEATDQEVLVAIERAVAAGRRVVLYAMDHSKLGAACPSGPCLEHIATTFGAAVQIVIDACQTRIGRRSLLRHLARGRMVLITGSKFFAGPPLSGAMLLPPALAARIADVREVPPGVRHYSRAGDWPSGLARVRAALDPAPNVGQLLRWSAALEEMAAFYAVPPPHRADALLGFAAAVPRTMAAFEEFSLLPDATTHDRLDTEFSVRTIFPFTVRTADGLLSPEACGKLYRALNCDVRPMLPPLMGAERGIAARPCHIGQPVAVGDPRAPAGALRVSASARLVHEDTGLAERLEQVFAKLRLLLRHRDSIERAF